MHPIAVNDTHNYGQTLTQRKVLNYAYGAPAPINVLPPIKLGPITAAVPHVVADNVEHTVQLKTTIHENISELDITVTIQRQRDVFAADAYQTVARYNRYGVTWRTPLPYTHAPFCLDGNSPCRTFSWPIGKDLPGPRHLAGLGQCIPRSVAQMLPIGYADPLSSWRSRVLIRMGNPECQSMPSMMVRLVRSGGGASLYLRAMSFDARSWQLLPSFMLLT
jgi:hypothetical protein